MKKDVDSHWLCRPPPSVSGKDPYDDLDWAPACTGCRVSYKTRLNLDDGKGLW